MENKMDDNELANSLKEAIRAEYIAGKFYKYISSQIKNGKIRDKFRSFADDENKKHKDMLTDRLKGIASGDFKPESIEMNSSSDTDKFSLIGAIKMAKTSEAKAIKFYNRAKRNDKKEYRKMYETIIKDEKKHWRYLDKEKKFINGKMEYQDETGLRLFNLLKDSINKT